MLTVAVCLSVVNSLFLIVLAMAVGLHSRIIRRLAGMPSPEEKMREWGWTR
jgi:Na+-transporting methylmalonyl-CoA/oxaloacetate decarboxylase gamma subunit